MYKSLVRVAQLMMILCLMGSRLLAAETPDDTPPKAFLPEIQSLQDEIRRLQRDQIDLQKSLMESGAASPTLKEDLAKLRNMGELANDVENLKKEKKELLEAVESSKKMVEAATGGDSKDALTKMSGMFSENGTQTIAINMMWTLITGFMVMFMQAGFAMVECGFTRAKNVAHTACMNFMVYGISILAYWAIGFCIQFGGTGSPDSVSTVTTLGPEVAAKLNVLHGLRFGEVFIGLFGGAGAFLSWEYYKGGIFTLFLFQMIFGGTAAIIPTGAMAERWKFSAFALTSVFIAGFIYPLFGCWTWGGGWLAALGKNFGLGHGHIDFAGSSVVHVCGGTLAYVWAKKLGPRIGKFNKDGSANAIPGHNVPMGILGTFILAFGWFGFNPGSTLNGMDSQIGIIATNTMLASAAGAVTGMLCSWKKFGKPDPSFMCNGMLGGLVAITAPSAFVEAWASVVIGGISGILVVFATIYVESALKLDDPVGAVPVHGLNGVWGVLALGLFANGRYGVGANMVGAETYKGVAVVPGESGGVTGLFYGDFSQFIAQFIGTTTCVLLMAGLGWLVYVAVDKLLGGHRVAAADEIRGLDVPELGVLGYQPDVNPEIR